MDTKRDRRISRYRSDAARDRYLQAYDRALGAWPVPSTQLDVPTRFGTTHVNLCGSKDGAPIVLLHGVAASSPSWLANVAALGAHHPVYAIDTICDAGRSIQTAALGDASDMAMWLDEALAALDLRGVHLVGLSYGGWLALNQAQRAPDRIASVTSVDPPGAIVRMKVNLGFLPDAALAMLAKSDAALLRLLRRLNNGTRPPDPIVDLAIAALRTFVLKQPFPKRCSDEELGSIKTPTLLLFGERSVSTDAARAAERARRVVVRAETEIVPGVGHMIPIEEPEIFNERVLRFVDGIDQK